MSILIDYERDAIALKRSLRRFLLASLLVLIAIIAAIMVRQGAFRQTTKYSFVADTAQDISRGQPVRIAGFRVGSVTALTLRDDGRVDVTLEIDADQMRFVTHDARVELRKDGLVGAAALEIVPGADKTRLAAAQARLGFARADGLSALANQVRDEVMPILHDVKTLTAVLADPQHGLKSTLAHLDTLLDASRRQVNGVGGAATRTLEQAEAGLLQMNHTLTEVNTHLPPLLERSQRIVEHVEKITAEAQATVPSALRDGSAATADVREIVSGAKRAWPIRTLLEPPGPATLQRDSDPQAAAGGQPDGTSQ
jgi:ABC-type transporter Mla subunit MlaD